MKQKATLNFVLDTGRYGIQHKTNFRFIYLKLRILEMHAKLYSDLNDRVYFNIFICNSNTISMISISWICQHSALNISGYISVSTFFIRKVDTESPFV